MKKFTEGSSINHSFFLLENAHNFRTAIENILYY